MPFFKSWAIKGAVGGLALFVLHWWTNAYLFLDKYWLLFFLLFLPLHLIFTSFLLLFRFSYNAVHPYVSVVPLIVYIVLRNISPQLRASHSWMLAWIGKVSLESYLSQFHVWLGSDAKTVIWLFPNYPLVNFVIATGIFLSIAHLLFNITQALNEFIFPSNATNRVFIRNLLILVVFIAVLGFAEHLQNLARGYFPSTSLSDQ